MDRTALDPLFDSHIDALANAGPRRAIGTHAVTSCRVSTRLFLLDDSRTSRPDQADPWQLATRSALLLDPGGLMR